jgi:hypothetical protein
MDTKTLQHKTILLVVVFGKAEGLSDIMIQ